MDSKEKYFLHSSQLYVARNESWIVTVLGSCVAVCLYDKQLRIGGMNHFMLPLWNGQGLESPRYGNIAIPKLLELLKKNGSSPDHLVAKVFGGAKILGDENSYFQVGEANVDFVFRSLNELNIPVRASSTGGSKGRKIYFNSVTGEVFQKYVHPRPESV